MNAGEALYIGGRAESIKVVMNILEQLAEHAKYRTQQDKKITSLGEIKKQALSIPGGNFFFEKALRKPGIFRRSFPGRSRHSLWRRKDGFRMR